MEDLGSLEDIPSQLGDLIMETPTQGSSILDGSNQASIPSNSQILPDTPIENFRENIAVLSPAELAARAQNTLRNLINIATQIFKIIREMTSSRSSGHDTNFSLEFQAKKQKYLETSRKLKEITILLAKHISNNPPKPFNEAPVSEELLRKRDELRLQATQKNAILRELMEKILQMQFDINTMLTVSVPPNGWPSKSNGTPQTTQASGTPGSKGNSLSPTFSASPNANLVTLLPPRTH